MDYKVFEKLDNKKYLKEIYALMVGADKEFIPPLSARSSTTQQGLATATQGGIDLYFEQMKEQAFVVALDGDRVAGFMSFKKNYHNEYITGGDNLYASTCVVNPDYRGQGLMSTFYIKMIDAYPDCDIFTRTWHQNIGHLKVLDRLGFNLIKTLENDRGEGVHTVYYQRKAK